MWENSFYAMEKNGKLDDQAIFWNVLRHSVNPKVKDFENCSDVEPVTIPGGNTYIVL